MVGDEGGQGADLGPGLDRAVGVEGEGRGEGRVGGELHDVGALVGVFARDEGDGVSLDSGGVGVDVLEGGDEFEGGGGAGWGGG